MNIDHETVLRIAELARIDLNDNEVELFARQLTDILKYVEQLESVDELAEPFSFGTVHPNPMRPDHVDPSLSVDEVLKNAPQRAGRFFKVPRIIP